MYDQRLEYSEKVIFVKLIVSASKAGASFAKFGLDLVFISCFFLRLRNYSALQEKPFASQT